MILLYMLCTYLLGVQVGKRLERRQRVASLQMLWPVDLQSGTIKVYGMRSPRFGELVRVVEMNGCMAHVRSNVAYGRVDAHVRRNVYGSPQPVEYVRIQMDGGTTEELPAEPRLWTHHDGMLEYRK